MLTPTNEWLKLEKEKFFFLLTRTCVCEFWLVVLSRLFTVLKPFNNLANVVLFFVSRPSVGAVVRNGQKKNYSRAFEREKTILCIRSEWEREKCEFKWQRRCRRSKHTYSTASVRIYLYRFKCINYGKCFRPVARSSKQQNFSHFLGVRCVSSSSTIVARLSGPPRKRMDGETVPFIMATRTHTHTTVKPQRLSKNTFAYNYL